MANPTGDKLREFEIMKRLKDTTMSNILLFDISPSIVTLTLSWHMGNMGSAHPMKVNISAKFEKNPLIGI